MSSVLLCYLFSNLHCEYQPMLYTLSETQVKGSMGKKYFAGGIRNSLTIGFNGLLYSDLSWLLS